MAADNDSYVQVQVDSTGKKIRNLVLGRVVLDGNPPSDGVNNYYMQVVALVDAEGRLIPPQSTWQTEMLAEQRKTNELLELMLDRLR